MIEALLWVWAAFSIVIIGVLIHGYRIKHRNLEREFDHVNSIAKNGQAIAKRYIDTPKLISIHRNGRLNLFTFAIRDEFVTIETMGMLSDTPDQWRNQLGLTE